MGATIAVYSSMLFLLSVGFFCLLRPRNIQAYALKNGSDYWWPKKKWVMSNQYLWSLRFSGVLAILMASALFYVLVESHFVIDAS